MKHIKYLFILAFFLPLLLTQKTNAITYDQQFKFYFAPSSVTLVGSTNVNMTNLAYGSWSAYFTATPTAVSFGIPSNLTITQGDVISFSIGAFNQKTPGALQFPASCFSSTNQIMVMDCRVDSEVIQVNSQSLTLPSGYSGYYSADGNQFYVTQNNQVVYTLDSGANYLYYNIDVVAKYTGPTGQGWFTISGSPYTGYLSQSQITQAFMYIPSISVYSPGATVKDVIQYLQDHPDNSAAELHQMNQQDAQDRSSLNNQQSDSESSAEDTAEAITSASDSLLAVISNFVNIIIHPPQRDCTISGDMGHMDLGTIDLCQLSPPPAVSTVATLLIIGFVIPFAYGVISTILNLLKGATQ